MRNRGRQSGMRIGLLAATYMAAGTAVGGEPCCSITAIDLRSGTVTARELSGRRTIEFKVADTSALRALRVGQAVFADTGFRQIALTDGAAPCCAITIRPAEPVGTR